MPLPQSDQPIVALVSLGCAKNEVDSERILAGLLSDGFLLAEDPAESDLCLVNTCGFIEDAREETREVLEELAVCKASGRPAAVVALGAGDAGHRVRRRGNRLHRRLSAPRRDVAGPD